MADTIIISGISDGAFDNALENAFGRLPAWATEDTSMRIEGLLKKLVGLQTTALSQMAKTAAANGTALSGADLDRTNKEIARLFKNFKGLNEEADKKKKRDKDEDDHHKQTLSQWAKSLTSFKNLTAAVSGAGLAIKKTFVDNINTFDKLYASGINVVGGFDSAASGFEALSQLSTITGVRFTELSETIVKYNTAVNSFGLAKFAKTFGGAAQELTQFGYSAKESADLLGSYLESQRGFNDVNARTQESVQKDLIRFGDRVTRLSQATGILRSKLLENIEAVSQTIEMNILAGRIGEMAAGATSEFIASFKDKSTGDAFLRMMTDAIKPLNATFMDFQKTGFGGFGQKLMSFTQSLEGLSGEEAAKRTAEFAKANDEEIKMMIQRGNLLRAAGVKEADGMLKMAVGLQQQGRTYVEVSAADRAKADKTAKASKDLQNEWEGLMAQLQKAFGPTIPLLEKLATLLGWVNTSIDAVAGVFDYATKSWVGAGVILAGFLGSLTITAAIINSIGKRLAADNLGDAIGGGGKGKGKGKLGKGLKVGAGAVAGLGLAYASDKLEEAGHNNAAAATNIAAAAATGASLGALLGPIGAIVGGLTGAAVGTYSNWDNFGSNPKQSKIDSPFTKGPKETEKSPETITETPSTSVDTARGADRSSTDINSTLNYQNVILSQLLETSKTLVSVNKDILKYAKVT